MYKCKICRFAQISFRIFVRFVEGDKMDKTLERIVNELKLQKKRKIDLTDHLGMVNSAFGHWVSGRNKSYLKYLYAIAAYLDVSVEYLKGETDIKKSIPANQKDIEDFLSSYSVLSSANKKIVSNLIDSLLENQNKENI